MKNPPFLCAALLLFALAGPGNAQTQDAAAGSLLYRSLCASCHGVSGDGNGPVGRFLLPLPRDFRKAEFKYVSGNGGGATDHDLLRAIARGLTGSGMPSFGSLTLKEQETLITVIRGFAGTKQARAEEIPFPAGIQPDPARGQQLYENHCALCHGSSGRGDGPAAQGLLDGRGDPVRPRDLTKKADYRGGSMARDVYYRVRNGMPGSAMPAFELPDQDILSIAAFVTQRLAGNK